MQHIRASENQLPVYPIIRRSDLSPDVLIADILSTDNPDSLIHLNFGLWIAEKTLITCWPSGCVKSRNEKKVPALPLPRRERAG